MFKYANKEPLVSVIVPVYNHENYIKQCLTSIVDSGYGSYEIVIIDDGSTDNSVAVIKKWIESNPNVQVTFTSRSNKGVSKTLNEAILMSKGDLICILASDDCLLPKSIAVRVQYLLSNPDKQAVFGDSIVIDGSGEKIRDSGFTLHGGDVRALRNKYLLEYELTYHWCVPGPVFMAWRSVYDQVGFYDENLSMEDFDFYLRLISRKILGYIDYKVAAYRLHDANTIRIHKKDPLKVHRLFIDTLKNNLNEFEFSIRWRLQGKLYLHRYQLAKHEKRIITALYLYIVGKILFKSTGNIYKLIKKLVL